MTFIYNFFNESNFFKAKEIMSNKFFFSARVESFSPRYLLFLFVFNGRNTQ